MMLCSIIIIIHSTCLPADPAMPILCQWIKGRLDGLFHVAERERERERELGLFTSGSELPVKSKINKETTIRASTPLKVRVISFPSSVAASTSTSHGLVTNPTSPCRRSNRNLNTVLPYILEEQRESERREAERERKRKRKRERKGGREGGREKWERDRP